MKKRNYEPYFFYGLMLVHLIYVWLIPIFLTQDGPIHLYNSKILLDLISDNQSDFYLQYFEINKQISPNWFSTIPLAFLLKLFSPIVVEKIFISFLILLLPLSIRYTLNSINPKALFLSSIAFVFSNSFFLIYGFYNFQWSLIFFCFFIGYYIKHQKTLSIKQTIKLSLLCLLTFFTHPVAFIQIGLFIGIQLIMVLVTHLKEKKTSAKQLLTKTLVLSAIILPSSILFLVFFLNPNNATSSIFEIKLSLIHFKALLSPTHLWTFDRSELHLLRLFSILTYFFLGIAIFKTKVFRKNKTSIYFIVLLLINIFIYFFVNDELAGGSYLMTRITIFINLILIFLSAAHSFKKTEKLIYLITSFLICSSFLIIRYPFQKKISTVTEKYISINQLIKNKSSVLPLGFSNNGKFNSIVLSKRLDIFKHISGYLGSQKQLISFENREADTDYCSLIWTEDKKEKIDLFIGSSEVIEKHPTAVNILKFNQLSDCNIDYVVLFGDTTHTKRSNKPALLFTHLKQNYKLIYKDDTISTYLYINSNLLDSITLNK